MVPPINRRGSCCLYQGEGARSATARRSGNCLLERLYILASRGGFATFAAAPCSRFHKSRRPLPAASSLKTRRFQVNRGDRVGLVGPNGAGKSTLFSLILGEASPDEGRVSLEKVGHDRISSAGACARGRRNCFGTGLCRFAGGNEGATHHENDAGGFGGTPRGLAFV